jgi:glycosyltransferase involved in cell wall biosynthesis
MALRIFGTVDTFIEGAANHLRLGRLVANARFLVALILHSQFDGFHFFCPTVSHVRTLQATLERELGDLVRKRRISLRTHLHLPRQLRETSYAAFHVGGWGMFLPRLAHLRAKLGGPGFPLTGVTHSLHTADIFGKMREMVAAPFGPGDGVVCTSVGAQTVMQRHWDLAVARSREQGQPIVAAPLRFPRIPLAVDDVYFQPRDKAAARAALGLPADDVVSLYLGRLSPHTKANLNPVIDAHARLVRSAGSAGPRSRARLVLAGAGDAAYQADLGQAAAELGIADRVHIVTNVSDEQKHQLLAAADVFVSPVDNHQETFGLAVVEAMAAGLPVVASDFDGYRDLVDEGVTGFRIPTYGGRFPAGVDDLVGLLDPNLTALLMAETVALDNGVLLARLGQLIDDADLRRRLGAAGRARAARLYAWPQVIAAYEAMWQELGAAAKGWSPKQAPGDPQVGSLHDIFSHYPTALLTAQDRLRLAPFGSEVLLHGAAPPPLHQELLPLIDPEMGSYVLRFISGRGACTLGECAAAVEQEFAIDPAHTAFQVIWLLKQGLLVREPA